MSARNLDKDEWNQLEIAPCKHIHSGYQLDQSSLRMFRANQGFQTRQETWFSCLVMALHEAVSRLDVGDVSCDQEDFEKRGLGLHFFVGND